MNMETKIKTIILHTEQPTDIMNNTKGMLYYNYENRNFKGKVSYNEIYIIDDSVIEENDWFIKNELVVHQANDNITNELESNIYYGIEYEKIIATTDKELIKNGVLSIRKNDIIDIIELYNDKKLYNVIINDNTINKDNYINLEFRNYIPVPNSESKIISDAFKKIHEINKDKFKYSKEDVSIKIYEALGYFAKKHDIIIDGNELDVWIDENLK